MGGRQSTANYYSDSDSDDEDEGRERGAISADESSVSDDGGFNPRLRSDRGLARRGPREEGIEQEPEEKGLLPSERPDEPQRGSPSCINTSRGADGELPLRTLEPSRMGSAASSKELDNSDRSKSGRRRENPNSLSLKPVSPTNKPGSIGPPSFGKTGRSGLHTRPGNAVRLTGGSAGRLGSNSNGGTSYLGDESVEDGSDRGDGGVQTGRSRNAEMKTMQRLGPDNNGYTMHEETNMGDRGGNTIGLVEADRAASGNEPPGNLKLLMHSEATSAARQSHADQPTLPCSRSEPTTQTSDVDQLEAGPRSQVQKSVSSCNHNAPLSLDAPLQGKGLQKHPHKSPRFPMSVSGAVNAEVIEFAAASSEDGELEEQEDGEGNAEVLESMRDGSVELAPKSREEGERGGGQWSATAIGRSSDTEVQGNAFKATSSSSSSSGAAAGNVTSSIAGTQTVPCVPGVPGVLPDGLAALQDLPSHPFLHTAAEEPPDLRTEFYIIRWELQRSQMINDENEQSLYRNNSNAVDEAPASHTRVASGGNALVPDDQVVRSCFYCIHSPPFPFLVFCTTLPPHD